MTTRPAGASTRCSSASAVTGSGSRWKALRQTIEAEGAVRVGQRVQVDEREGDVDEAELGGEALALLEHVRRSSAASTVATSGAMANPAMPAPVA